MIWNSELWKKELSGIACWLSDVTNKRYQSEKLIFNLEKSIFVGFYIIRKLSEAKTISDETCNFNMKLISYRSLGKPVTFMNWHRVDELYNFSKPKAQNVLLCKVCNQLIHSYVFIPVTTSRTGPVKSILFCSDWKRNQRIYELEIKDIVKIFKLVAHDYPNNVRLTYDKGKQDYVIESHMLT
jgi:hypothetical protein